MSSLTIGKVARLTGLGAETIRYYERGGLISDPPRKESGYRQYPEETVTRLLFIKRAKKLGFTLQEIKELLSLRINPEMNCNTVRRQAEVKIAEIQDKLYTLRKMEQALNDLVTACRERKTSYGCPILEAFEKEEKQGKGNHDQEGISHE